MPRCLVVQLFLNEGLLVLIFSVTAATSSYGHWKILKSSEMVSQLVDVVSENFQEGKHSPILLTMFLPRSMHL